MASTLHPNSIPNAFHRYSQAALVASLGLQIVFACAAALSVLLYPFELTYGEAPLLDQALRLQQNQSIYPANIHQPPYTISNYPPLYPLAVALLHRITHLPLFQTGRLIALAATLVSAALVGAIAGRLAGERRAGYLATILFVTHPFTITWAALARVDTLALAFSLSGLWVLQRANARARGLFLAGLLFLAAAFTRQTYLLAAPFAGAVYLWLHNRRSAITFAAGLGTAVIALFFAINGFTQGGFATHIIAANLNTYDFSRALSLSWQFFLLAPASIALALWGWLQKPAPAARSWVWAWRAYFVGALFSALTVGKVGSDVNYFLELLAAMAILAGYAQTRAQAHKTLGLQAPRILLALQSVWGFLASLILIASPLAARWQNLPREQALFETIRSATQDGIVLSDDYLGMVVLAGQPIYYQPFEFGQLHQAGLWDAAPFAEEIARGQFSLIVIGGPTLNKPCCWPEAVQEAVLNFYQLSSFPRWLIYSKSSEPLPQIITP